MHSRIFGIDLGTTNSVAAIFRNGQIEVLPSKSGSKLFPSYVAYSKRTPGEYIVGEFAKRRLSQPATSIVVHDCKRLIGVGYDSEIVRRVQESVGYEIEDDGNNKPKIVVRLEGKVIEKYPEDIGAMVLREIATRMQEFMGDDIQNVVITVPAYFNQRQRDLTKAAGAIAGLNVVEIITEPQAAAYAYLDQRDVAGNSTLMVYDLGGGTFDVTILKVSGEQVEEVALDGDTLLGGSDLDMILLDKVKEEYKVVIGNPLPQRLIPKMRDQCEQAKISLTSLDSVSIALDDDHFYELSRTEMNHLFDKSIRRTLDICDRALGSANIHPEDVSQILLVGGSTRLKLVQTLLEEHYPEAKILKTINPDECVAYGAAKYAYNWDISGKPIPEFVPYIPPKPNPSPASPPNVEILPLSEEELPPPPPPPVPPVSESPVPESPSPNPVIRQIPITKETYKCRCSSDIGIEKKKEMFVLIKRGTELPAEGNLMMKMGNRRSTVRLTLYQGNDKLVKNNTALQTVKVSVDPTKDIYLCLSLKMNENGSLSLHLADYQTGNEIDYNEIEAAISKDEIRNRSHALKEEENERGRLEQMNKLRNKLLNKANALLWKVKSEDDRNVLNQEYSRFEQMAITSTTQEVIDNFTQLLQDMESRIE